MNDPSHHEPTRRHRAGSVGVGKRTTRRIAVLAGAVLVGWSLFSLVQQMRTAMRPSPGAWSPVFAWRALTPPVQEVRRFAELAGARVPEGEAILFTLSPDDPDARADDEFFLSMWTAYHLPHHPVLRRQNVAPGAAAPRYRLDVTNWPPSQDGRSAQPTPALLSEGQEARLLLDGLGTLWYVPSAPGRE